MFEIGFSEIFLIAVVALIVIGPEKLPRVAKTLGLLVSRLQRYVNDVKADINREIEFEELKKLQGHVEDAANTIKQSISETAQSVNSEISTIPEAIKVAEHQSEITASTLSNKKKEDG